ncbi:MAG: hypothetical protein NVSMB24_36090 [Mucilaginibacter sp.]
MQLTMLTKKPCQKYMPVQTLAITYAQKINITNQKAGSTFSGISDTVAKAIINPKIDN